MGLQRSEVRILSPRPFSSHQRSTGYVRWLAVSPLRVGASFVGTYQVPPSRRPKRQAWHARREFRGRLLHKASGQARVVLNGQDPLPGRARLPKTAKDGVRPPDRRVARERTRWSGRRAGEGEGRGDRSSAWSSSKFIGSGPRTTTEGPDGKCSGQLPSIKQAHEAAAHGSTAIPPSTSSGPRLSERSRTSCWSERTRALGSPSAASTSTGWSGTFGACSSGLSAEELVSAEVLHGLQAVRDLRAGRVGDRARTGAR